MEVQAVTKFTGISPQKARLVLDEMRGRRAEEALAFLAFMPSSSFFSELTDGDTRFISTSETRPLVTPARRATSDSVARRLAFTSSSGRTRFLIDVALLGSQ